MAKLDKKEVSGQQFIIEELRSIRSAVRRMEYGSVQRSEIEPARFRHDGRSGSDIDLCMGDWAEERIALALRRAMTHLELDGARITELEVGHKHLLAEAKAGANLDEITRALRAPRIRIHRPPPSSPPREAQ